VFTTNPDNKCEFIILQGIEAGNSFFTMNTPTETEIEKCTVHDGTIAYRILGYADTVYDAQMFLYGDSEYTKDLEKKCHYPKLGDELYNDEVGEVLIATECTLNVVRVGMNRGLIFVYRARNN
jgi:hypothetical protein